MLEVTVDKGSPDGEKYFFHGEADEHPVKEAGDVDAAEEGGAIHAAMVSPLG